MYKKTHSLRRKKEIERVFLHGKKAVNRFFLARYISNQDSKGRICVMVSKKVSKQAVRRNKLKRQIKYAIKKNKLIKTGLDIVLAAFPDIAKADYSEIEKQIIYVFTKKINRYSPKDSGMADKSIPKNTVA